MSYTAAHLVAIYILTGAILISAVPTVHLSQTDQVSLTEDVPRECREFSVVTEDQNGHVEFYSPGYPKNYSNNLDCVLKIVAEFGYQINVDFRDYFSVEPSEKCENDFLEIRDGPHGYSDSLGKFCGKSFPPKITSKGRYLWLRFFSDDSLKYEGFRAVYEVFKNPNIIREEVPPCHFIQMGFQGLITEKNISQSQLNYSITYSLPLDCTWQVEVAPDKKIYLFFEVFKLHKPNECDQNYVDIFEGKRDMTSRKKHYCGSVADPVVSTGNLIFFRYFAIRATIQSEFTAFFTAFRDKETGVTKPPKKTNKNEEAEEVSGPDECYKDEYDCDDATCIDASLRCNGIRNCRHMYDEEDCKDSSEAEFDISSQHIVVILTIGCGLLAGMCFAMCFNCIKKLVRDGKQIHENIRRSREQLEGKRTASMASFARNTATTEGDVPCFIESKLNGRPCFHSEDDDAETDEEEEEDDDLEQELEIEMRDCECQTRDTAIRVKPLPDPPPGTPPPPPPPMRRPPDVPPASPFIVPTPPPPPASHYARYPSEPAFHYGPPAAASEQPVHHYEGSDAMGKYKQRYRSETLIHMTDGSKWAGSPRAQKAAPDVLAMH